MLRLRDSVVAGVPVQFIVLTGLFVGFREVIGVMCFELMICNYSLVTTLYVLHFPQRVRTFKLVAK